MEHWPVATPGIDVAPQSLTIQSAKPTGFAPKAEQVAASTCGGLFSWNITKDGPPDWPSLHVRGLQGVIVAERLRALDGL